MPDGAATVLTLRGAAELLRRRKYSPAYCQVDTHNRPFCGTLFLQTELRQINYLSGRKCRKAFRVLDIR